MSGLNTPELQEETTDSVGTSQRAHKSRRLADTQLRWFTQPEDLKPYIRSWDELAEIASEPNVFLESWYLLPAMELLREDEDIAIGLVLEGSSTGRERVIGVFPMERNGRGLRSPLGAIGIWRHRQCFLCTPLMAPGREKRCWEMLLAHVDSGVSGKVLKLPFISVDGPVYEALRELLAEQQRPMEIQTVYRRAMMVMDNDADSYLARGSAARKEYGRKLRRLRELGDLQTVSMDTCEDHRPWIEEFLRLEASGWKGKAQSAMACSDADQQFIMTIAEEGHRRERLMMLGLRLDDELVAGELNLMGTRGSCFGLKVAFDERYAQHSPGMVLSLEGIRVMHDERRAAWIDCCCAPGNNSMQRLWNEQRVIATVALPARGWFSRLTFAALPLARQIRRLMPR